ncbi:Uma2 family endonuclease [Nostocaceae cyanobacterium CENA357]|uniref:Uma2 family endonuclease n=1 Tax=Atlanticothrix silvestris CENA357 TaxID=1725252 RepID=A0A8J7L0C2_9CYAN|nr:Uma2 family endonuclease [Atlanticothrix silvestris]MBH8552009.1 Uma2 family endonuclease [Atlanticothrix silvestris CENA357]
MNTAIASPTNITILQGIHWDTYRNLVRDLESQPGMRLTYDGGILEIMMPLPPHETFKKLLGRFAEVMTEEIGIEIRSLGSTTWTREDLQKGLEPDECYYIQNELAVRGKDAIDLTIDPPPDLAIEVDSTNSSMNRMGIYAALGVPEVWCFDREILTISSLVNDDYQPLEMSLVLPMFSVGVLRSFLELSLTMGETSLICHVRQWVREQLAQS